MAVYAVDNFGRDPHLVAALSPLARLRWNVQVSGADNVPNSAALLVCNSRRFALGAVYAALGLTDVTGRPVRFVGRPDTAPLGALMRRVGALLPHPSDVLGALRDGQLVLISAAGTRDPRHAGVVPQELVGQAVIAQIPVLPVTTISSVFSRTAHVVVGKPTIARRERTGPLAHVELAEQVQHDLQRMLDEA
ncbi:hypothetical protein BH10ACT2_BH10ACT2_02600 [soil metagenome]